MPRKYVFDILLGQDEPPTAAMRHGMMRHEETQRRLGVEYDLDPYEIVWRLRQGRIVITGENCICSPTLGRMGHPDVLILLLKPPKLYVKIVEIKQTYRGSYWMQAFACAWLFTQKDMLIGDVAFYEELAIEPLSLNISVSLLPYYNPMYCVNKWFMRNNLYVPLPENPSQSSRVFTFSLKNFHKKYLGLEHSPDWMNLPLCDFCPMLKDGEPEGCGYLGRCLEYPAPHVQARLSRFGVRRKLLKSAGVPLPPWLYDPEEFKRMITAKVVEETLQAMF